MNKIMNKLKLVLLVLVNALKQQESGLLLMGNVASNNLKKHKFDSINDTEFKVFSQFGDDGIIQYLIQNLDIKNKTFCEFGVEDYRESNTRFLLINNHWTGLVIDGSRKNIRKIKNSEYYWKYNVEALCTFVTKDNINEILQNKFGSESLGILHIDIDGVDYWIWKNLESSPDVVIVEYNSILGTKMSITVPYEESFYRYNKHYSGLYYGASINAFNELAMSKGYVLVGGNNAGNNLYFVKKELLNEKVREVGISEAYKIQSFTEEKNKEGVSTLRKSNTGSSAIVGLDFYCTKTDKLVKFIG